jgi:ABC-type sugar transport system permease subunit
MYMYEEAFGAQDIGVGSAAAFILLAAIAVTTLIQWRIGRRMVAQ